MKRRSLVIGLTLLLTITLTIPALAGGWAVISLDELPGKVPANQPLEIGFMLRQHGVTPMRDQSPVITAQLANSTKSVKVSAHAEGKVGHYVATLTLPQSGQWQWSIQAFTVNQPMPALTVIDATMAMPASEPIASNQNPLSLLIGGVGLLGTLSGLLAVQRKARWAAIIVMIGLLVSGVGFAWSVRSRPDAKTEAQVESPTSFLSQVELGHNLFIAKGCMVCHSHIATNSFREFGVDIGPDLSNIVLSPDYLRLWLKNPSAVKSTAKMPNLELSDAEIEALIAFINDK